MSDAAPSTPPDFSPVSRRFATLVNLLYTNASTLLYMIRGLVLPPLFLMFIDSKVLGAWMSLTDVLNWIMMSEGGAWLLLRQQTAQEFGREDRTALGEAIGTGMLLLMLLGALIASVALAIAPFAPGWLGVSGETASTLSWAFSINGVALALSLPACCPRAVQQGFQQQIGVNAALLSAEALSLVATAVFLYSGVGVLSIAWGILLREVLHNLINWPLLALSLRRLHVRPRISRARLRSTLPLMAWTFVSNLGTSLRNNLDAFVVGRFIGLEWVPMMRYSRSIWDIGANMFARLANAFTPALSHLWGEGDLVRFRAICGQLLALLALALAVLLAGGWALNESFLRVWLPEPMYCGRKYDVLLGVGTLLSVFSSVALDLIFSAGHVRASAQVQLMQSFVRIASLLALVHFTGILAIPLSMIAAVLLGGSWTLLRHWTHTLQFERRELLLHLGLVLAALAAAGIVGGLWKYAPRPESWLMLSVHGAIVALATTAFAYAIDPSIRGQANQLVAAGMRRVGRR